MREKKKKGKKEPRGGAKISQLLLVVCMTGKGDSKEECCLLHLSSLAIL